MMLQTNYQDSWCFCLGEDFKSFHYISLCKTCDVRERANFVPLAITYTILIEVHQMMLYTKYQSSRPSCLGEEDF